MEALNIQAVLLAGDDHKRRDELFEQTAALARRIGDDRRLAVTNIGRGKFSLEPGKGAQARPFYEAALTECAQIDLPDGVGWCHDHLGWAALVDGEYDRREITLNRPSRWPAAILLANGSSRTRWPPWVHWSP